MSFRRYLETRYATACRMQRGITRDALMVTMLREGPQDGELVYAWMRDYGLFQGINGHDRNAVVKRFLGFAAEHERCGQEPTAAEIEALYLGLFSALHGEVARSWASATSKLLWCLYPDTIVIYDAFVHRALGVLQCIDGDLERFPRIGEPPKVDDHAGVLEAVRHYMNYQSMVRRLLTSHARLLGELRARHNERYPYDVRIVDKVLWMMGNCRESFGEPGHGTKELRPSDAHGGRAANSVGNIPRWSDNSREERYFTAVLFQALVDDACPLWGRLRPRLGIAEQVTVVDVGYEVCLFRDLAHAGHMQRVSALEKQTFDLVLTLSDRALVLIEAKAHQGFSTGQLENMMLAGEVLMANSGLGISRVHVAGLHSSRYDPLNVRTRFPALALVTWAELVASYPEVKDRLQRADDIYDN